MTEEELKVIENGPWGDKGPAKALVDEVRRLRGENQFMATTWIPPEIARSAARSGQEAIAEKIAQLVETMTDEHRRQGHALLGFAMNDSARDRYRAIAAFIRLSVREALR